jgi:hypothetical protein
MPEKTISRRINMKRRLLSAFLAVMMVLTMAPVAFAANSGEVSSTEEVSTAVALQTALTNATDGTVIKLTDNITVSSRAKFSGQSMTVTLDLNNYTLTGSDGDYALSNENGNGATTGKLIVKNGTIKRAVQFDCPQLRSDGIEQCTGTR